MKTARDVEDEAAKWLVRNDKSELSPDEIASFESWLAADVRHRAAYLRMQVAWRRASELCARMRPYDGVVELDLFVPGNPGRDPPRRLTIGLAALAVVALGVVASLTLGRAGWETASTPFGGHEQVALVDGTEVHLNTETEMRVRLTSQSREVLVVRGEAHFRVAHDRRRPFEVEANGAVVRVVGTAFTIRVQDRHRLDVLVDEGRVSIALAGGQRGAVPRMLSAGNAAMIDRDQIEIRKLGRDELARKLAWTEGRIWLDGETLAQAVREFNRYNHRRLIIADAAVAERRVGGSFEKTALDDFVHSLELSHDVRAVKSAPENGSPGEIRLYEK